MKVGLIWAQTEDGVIGTEGKLPWHLPEDLAHFQSVTEGHPVIMGRKTWESLPGPLTDRAPIIVTRQHETYVPKGNQLALVSPGLKDALWAAENLIGEEDWTWIIGGSQLFHEALALDVVDAAIITLIRPTALPIRGDVFAPQLNPKFWSIKDYRPKDGKGWFSSRNENLSWRIVELERNRG